MTPDWIMSSNSSANADGTDTKQLTRGQFEVRNVDLSPDEQTFYLTTNEVSPFIEHLYRMSVNGGARQQITSRAGRHRAVVSPNGRKIADSGEGYGNKADCLAAIQLVKEGAPRAPVEDTTAAETVGRW